MRWIPPTPSAAMLVLGSLAVALSSQGSPRDVGVIGAALAAASAGVVLASYGRLYSSMSSRRPRLDPLALGMALAPYAASLLIRGPRLIPWYAAPAASFSMYMVISLRGLGRSPAGLTLGATSLSLLSLAFSGILGDPLHLAIPASIAWSAFSAFGVLLVESRIPGRGVHRLLPLASLLAGLLTSSVMLPPLALAFVEPIYLYCKYGGIPVDARSLRPFGRRIAISSALFISMLILIVILVRVMRI
ncbi:MAG: hypothetical protein ACP5G6_05740 [Conexivisphaera sp.]